jgi:hypothetical protein
MTAYEYLGSVEFIEELPNKEWVRQDPLAHPSGEGAGEDSEGGVNSGA